MKQILLTILTIAALTCASVHASVVRNVDRPVITTMLEQRDGSKIKLSFRAIHWDEKMMAALQKEKTMRDYFNTYFGPRMGFIDTNVKLKFGHLKQIDPGQYFLGFQVNEPLTVDRGPTWSMLISNESSTLVTLPVTTIDEESATDYLSFLFTPGITDRDFMFHMMYGNMSTAVRWTILGVPSKTANSLDRENPAWRMLSPGTENAAIHKNLTPSQQAATAPPQGKTPQNGIKPKAGSGSLRYLDELEKQKNNSDDKDDKDR